MLTKTVKEDLMKLAGVLLKADEEDEKLNLEADRCRQRLQEIKTFMEDGGHAHDIRAKMANMMAQNNLKVFLYNSTVYVLNGHNNVGVYPGLYLLEQE